MSAITHREVLENFEAVRVLGEGSFGKVFLIRHKQTRVEFAMKKYSKYHILKNGKERGLRRSTQILKMLRHKRVVRLLYFSIDQDHDEIFLVFEVCKKGSLQQIKAKVHEIKEFCLVKQIMFQLTEGLAYLKSMSVAHRDVKPSNISFDSEGELKLIDFDEATCFKEPEEFAHLEEGFAKQFIQQTSAMKMSSRRSRANSFVGTELYMSPEMKQSTKTDERGDIWALGCIFYELIAGRSFFTEYEDEEELEIHLEGLKYKLQEFQIDESEISITIDMIKRVLQQNPDNRLSIEELAQHKFFQGYQGSKQQQTNKSKLRKFLRGNYNISKPENLTQALRLDLIGMSAGKQKFQALFQYPILVHCRKTQYQEQQQEHMGLWSRVKQYVKKKLNIPFYKVNLIMGGNCYFKVRSPSDDEKTYIEYDEIDCIRIVDDRIVIEGSNTEKWTRNSRELPCTWRFSIKAINHDQLQLGILYDTLMYIFND